MDWLLVVALVVALCCAVVLVRFGPTAYRVARSLSYYRRGLRYYHEQKLDEAESMWRRALEISRLNASACLALGKLLVQRGDAEGALEQYRAALAVRPTYWKARMNMANVLLGRRRFDEAIEQYRQAADGGIHTANKLLGMLYEHHLKDTDLALDYYRRYLQQRGSDVEVLAAVARLSQQRDDAARPDRSC